MPFATRAATAYGAARLVLHLAAAGIAHRPRRQSILERLAALPMRGLPLGAPVEIDTVFKSAHGLVSGRHAAGYGSNARHLFDLSDLDANRLVILGGQDGAPGSAAFLDQAELFRRGEYLDLPLRPETARARFPHQTVLRP